MHTLYHFLKNKNVDYDSIKNGKLIDIGGGDGGETIALSRQWIQRDTY
jgi:hypothetical protein